jgi:hypothetical protein
MKEENLKVWNDLKQVPADAKKKITGGRLKGMTDISPQWRLKMMTEQFGVIGIGWYYEIVKTWTEEHAISETTVTSSKLDTFDHNRNNESTTPKPVTANKEEEIKVTYEKEISVHIIINLFIKDGDNWSKPIIGIGGSMLLAIEKYGIHHSDEAYKMATTDALSVAMKELGVAADVYMGLSDSKYDKQEESTVQPLKKATDMQKRQLKDCVVKLKSVHPKNAEQIEKEMAFELTYDRAQELYEKSCTKLGRKV